MLGLKWHQIPQAELTKLIILIKLSIYPDTSCLALMSFLHVPFSETNYNLFKRNACSYPNNYMTFVWHHMYDL